MAAKRDEEWEKRNKSRENRNMIKNENTKKEIKRGEEW